MHMHYENCADWVRINSQNGKLIVVPLRDPAMVWLTWNKTRAYAVPERKRRFKADWARLAAYADEYPLFFFPVDAVDMRDAKLKELGELVGRELTTEWKPIGHRYRKIDSSLFAELDLSEIYQYPFVAEFYDQRTDLPSTEHDVRRTA